jgi:phage tail sheath protein FI
MVQVSYPGVYIQEFASGVRTIAGVSTSVGAFLGRASKGPIDQPVRLLSYADYERAFGEPHAQSDLADSVRLFFANGGTDCYVVRLAPGATAATVTVEDLNGQSVLVATAKAAGLWGNTVRLEVDYDTTNPDESFNLLIIHEEAGSVVQTENYTGLTMNPGSARFAPSFVTQSSGLIELGLAAGMGDATDSTSFINTIGNSFAGYTASRRPLRDPLNSAAGGTAGADMQAALSGLFAGGETSFDVSVNGSSYVTVDLSVAPALPATIAGIEGNIASKINAMLAGLSPAPTVSVALSSVIAGFGRFISITSTNGNESAVSVRRASVNDIAGALMLGVDQGGIELPRWSNFRPTPSASIVRIGNPATPGAIGFTNGILTIAENAITQLTINSTNVALNTSDFNIQTTGAPANPWYMNAAGDSAVTGDNDGVREKLRIIAQAINAEPDLSFRAEVWGYQLAIMATGGSLDNEPSTLSSGTPAFDNSLQANVRQYSLGQDVGNFSTSGVPGTDGGVPDLAAYQGSEADQTGLYALDPVDLFNLMVIPGDSDVAANVISAVWGLASVYCQNRRAFLLVDPPAAWTNSNGRPEIVQDTGLVNQLRATLVKDYCAVFYPRIRINAGGLVKTIGPAGAVAGLMARTDGSRGVWKAPAGIDAGIRDIVGVNLELTDLENGVLNKKGVNCIRVLPNGIVNWGARTLDGDDDFGSEWKYIPIRRLALMIEESLYRGSRWAVFEPNDEPLWANLRLNIGAFMNSLFRQGAFQGSSPTEAYYVRCDSSTTTQTDRNLGIVNVEVGFAPLKPAEFVVIKIQQMAGQIEA